MQTISLYRDKWIFMDLEDWSTRLKVFADATRVRLLALLERVKPGARVGSAAH